MGEGVPWLSRLLTTLVKNPRTCPHFGDNLWRELQHQREGDKFRRHEAGFSGGRENLSLPHDLYRLWDYHFSLMQMLTTEIGSWKSNMIVCGMMVFSELWKNTTAFWMMSLCRCTPKQPVQWTNMECWRFPSYENRNTPLFPELMKDSGRMSCRRLLEFSTWTFIGARTICNTLMISILKEVAKKNSNNTLKDWRKYVQNTEWKSAPTK